MLMALLRYPNSAQRGCTTRSYKINLASSYRMKHKPRVGSLFAWITLYGSNQADPSLKWARKSNQPELQIIDMTVLFTNQAPLQSTCSTSRAYRLSAQHAVGAFFFFYVCSLFGLHRLKAELTITARRSMAFRGLLQLGPIPHP